MVLIVTKQYPMLLTDSLRNVLFSDFAIYHLLLSAVIRAHIIY